MSDDNLPVDEQAAVERPTLPGRVIRPNATSKPPPAENAPLFRVEKPQRELKDLILPAETKQQIDRLLTKIRYQHILYDKFGMQKIDPSGGRTAINLYGPPGTGKSFAAEAIAHALQMEMIRINYAEVESKFVGETAKNIKAAFDKARAVGAVLFFDEADSILGKRLSNVRQSTDHAVNISRSVMLLELDHFVGVTIFATNLASNYDTAFVRRILGHVEMPLPQADERRQLWRYHIPDEMPVSLNSAEWEELVTLSDGLAGGDILNIVINAASSALEREGENCTIVLADFSWATQTSQRAKAVIGA